MARVVARPSNRTSNNDSAAGCFFLIILGMLGWYFWYGRSAPEAALGQLEQLRSAQQEQISDLQHSVEALSALAELIEREKSESEQVSQDLQTNISRFRKIVDVEQDRVDAIFEEQTLRTERTKWRDFGIGFVLGVFSSLVAQFVWSYGARWHKKRSEAAI